ncbi:leucine rich repeat LRR-containing protein [Nitzschia inconspicua]|uniref:Leucine rich repeat LRR-containing protein n=1 Tax=Nitzschia inconspicua TaxID=303405 RepID=A0A9K3Q5F2_9STRA|nr:leucine rich repeat LRR-containing protein [Nitzschia inconspicua]
MVSLSLDGSSMTSQAIAEALVRIQKEENGDPSSSTDELFLREVDFDADQVALVVDVIRSKSSSGGGWKSIHISHCSGLVNDAIMACMSSTNLPNLFLQQSVINPQTTYCLTYGLKYNKELLSLKLSIPWDASTSRNLSTALARNFTLQELSLENSTNFEEPGVVMNLSFGLRLNQHLKSLNLDGCYLQDEHVSSMLLALDGHSSIGRLSLKRNSCHHKGMSAVATLLHANQLQELDLSFLVRPTKEQREREEQKEEEKEETQDEEDNDEKNEFSETDGVDDDAKPPAKDDDKESEIEPDEAIVDDEDNDDDENDLEEEAETQVRNTSLRFLWLAGNGVGDDYLESVMNVFGKGSQLETLSLFGNRLSSQGIKRNLLKKLPHLKNMKKLFLGNNTYFKPVHLRDELIEALEKNYSLEEVMIKDLMETDPDTIALQDLLTYYCRLNKSGRRIMACFVGGNKENAPSVPLGLWPVLFERANRMHHQKVDLEDWVDQVSNEKISSYAADAIYSLLHGPVLYENHDLVPLR